jgi:hypothetical protein
MSLRLVSDGPARVSAGGFVGICYLCRLTAGLTQLFCRVLRKSAEKAQKEAPEEVAELLRRVIGIHF